MSRSPRADFSQNFMKCLMRMHAKDNKGVIFFETIPSFRQQRHTYIEAVPVPFAQFQDCPAYFKVGQGGIPHDVLLCAWLLLLSLHYSSIEPEMFGIAISSHCAD